MTSLLILIKDNINNTYSLYDNKYESGFKNCIDFLEKETSLQFKNVIIEDKICELFVEKKYIQKGWVWNTDITDAIKMYTLSFISIKNNNSIKESFTQTEKNEMVDKEIQNPNHIFTKNSSIQTEDKKLSYNPINYFKYEIDEEKISNYTYCEPKYCFTYNLTNKEINNTEPIDKKYRKKEIIPDYSLNDRLISELKQNLKTSNYGLRRRIKKNIHQNNNDDEL